MNYSPLPRGEGWLRPLLLKRNQFHSAPVSEDGYEAVPLYRGQYNGQYTCQYNGQYNGQYKGKYIGVGQNNSKYSGRYSGQHNGRYNGQCSGQHSAQPRRPFRSRHESNTAPEMVRLHRLVRCFGIARSDTHPGGLFPQVGPDRLTNNTFSSLVGFLGSRPAVSP